MSARDHRTVFVAVDIETTGSKFAQRKIIAIGVVVGWGNGSVIEQRCFASAVPPPDQFEPLCWTEFWQDKQALLERIAREATRPDGTVRTQAEMLREFMDYMLSVERRLGPFGRGQSQRFALLSDNAAFDFGTIDGELREAGFSAPLRDSFTGYVRINDPSETAHAFVGAERHWIDAHVTASHDHWPVNDALCIFQQQVAVLALIEYRRQAMAYYQLCCAGAQEQLAGPVPGSE